MKKLIITFLFLFFTAATALAASVDVSYKDYSISGDWDSSIYFRTNTNPNIGGDEVALYYYLNNDTSTYKTSWEGLRNMKLDTGELFIGFCIDPWHLVSDGEAYLISSGTGYSVPSGTPSFATDGLEKAGYLISLWQTDNNPWQDAALQLAIWEALYGDNFEIYYSSSFSSYWEPGDILTYYNDYMSQLAAWDGTPVSGWSVMDFTNVTKQDMIVRAVPVPSALLFLWAGVLGISAVRRKKD